MDEVKTMVWECGSDKATGPDRYTFTFVKMYWDLLKLDIYEFVSTFLTCKKMPLGSNSSFITLLPKVSNSIHIKDFRPISIIGIHYKIIAKILANRLSKVFSKIVSYEQSVFIKDHQILDGLLILSEVIDWSLAAMPLYPSPLPLPPHYTAATTAAVTAAHKHHPIVTAQSKPPPHHQHHRHLTTATLITMSSSSPTHQHHRLHSPPPLAVPPPATPSKSGFGFIIT
ncbi:RNA-directed DNA polymerase, eukaryota, reverse transcriptase zinc-binding domain protein [Tanacetum coccineum]